MQLTAKDAAKLFRASEKTIQEWIDERGLPTHRVNDQIRFNQIELLTWAAANGISVSPEVLHDPESGDSPLTSVTNALEAGGIFRGVGGHDKQTVLRAMVDVLKLPQEVDREFLYHVLSAREALGSTGVGGGIAIPHPRNPIVLHVDRPTIALCYLKEPIDFAALDGLPVRILFALISPTIRMHLHLISRLAYMLHDSGFKDVVTREGPDEDILREGRRAEAGLRPDGEAS